MTENLQSIALVSRASALGAKYHRYQKRKYGGEPYTVHTEEVGSLLAQFGLPDFVVAAGLLHDAIEDTEATRDIIAAAVGDEVADLVAEVTDPEVAGTRAERKLAAREHFAKASPHGKSIKLADFISNGRDVVQKADLSFARLYLAEKEAALAVLKDASSPGLYALAVKTLNDSKRRLALKDERAKYR